jgi:hypothetical protein
VQALLAQHEQMKEAAQRRMAERTEKEAQRAAELAAAKVAGGGRGWEGGRQAARRELAAH